MGDWFTTERADEDTYILSEYRHREETHSYLLCGRERALLIDTGLGAADISAAVRALTPLPVSVVLTHAHWDHIGGLARFPARAVHRAERRWLTDTFPLPREAVLHELTAQPCAFPSAFDPARYAIFCGDVRTFRGGDRFDLGGRTVEAIHTPGHSPGHCCFYERARGYLFTGDLVYRGQLDMFYPTTDPQRFYASVRKICTLDAARLFPAHHALNISADMPRRVAEALAGLRSRGLLRHGSGTFGCGDFSLRL